MRIARMVAALAITGLPLLFSSNAQAQVLYDGALGTTPSQQNWSFIATGGTQTAPTLPASPFTTLDTTGNNLFQGGYSPLTPVVLNPLAGFVVRLDVRVTSETHASNDRAGFSAIVLGSDKKGIELGFWQDRIFAQNDTPLFTHGEEALFNTTAAITRYDLAFGNGSYLLSANGVPLLSGLLRDYTAFNGTPNPYSTPNFIFLGDDTTSARGAFQFAFASVTAAPEPGAFALLLLAAPFAAILRRRCR